jgi:hypothetical protein
MVPYEIRPMAGVQIQGGGPTTVVVEWPSRSVISKVVVIQTDGVLTDFTVELFNRNVVRGVSDSDSTPPDVGAIPEECYAVGPVFNGVNGVLKYFSDAATGGYGLAFYNQDPTAPGRQGVRPRKLYVRISPAGGGLKTFAICIGGMDAVD